MELSEQILDQIARFTWPAALVVFVMFVLRPFIPILITETLLRK